MRKSEKGIESDFSRKIRPYLIIAPALLVTIGILYPFISAIFYSFTNYSFRRQTYNFVGIENWVKMLSSQEFYHSLIVTIQYAIATTGSEMILGLGIALLMYKSKSKVIKFLKVALIFPLMIAPVIATLIWQLMTNTSVGIIEKFFNLFGLYNFPWASSPHTALFTVALIDIWVNTPFVMLLCLAGLTSLPKSPFESADIDGGTTWFNFKNLTLPMIKPFIYIALIFRLMDSLQQFTMIYSLTKGGPGNTLMNLSLTGYTKGFSFMRFGESMPYLLILWLAIYIISKKLVGNWLTTQKRASGKGEN